ncbi:uncharacterized protein LOC125669341 isoform X1 [Ostrea edulis]|uniref:uncharacterized protein LOC125669341 isoform X1 n=2 Tax=Ostrea edulis TaxID=37623 RepID=UPI0024AF21FA|nr:uncharacterized protein LOC125669341 isoform X1 [Ostrea edulis]
MPIYISYITDGLRLFNILKIFYRYALNLRIKVLCIVQSSLMWMSDASMPIMGQYKCRSSYDSKFSKADIRRQIKLFNVKYASSWIKHPKSAQSKFTTTMEELTASSFRRATGHFQQPLKFLIEVKFPFSARTMTIKEACANVGISFLNVMQGMVRCTSKQNLNIGIRFKDNIT